MKEHVQRALEVLFPLMKNGKMDYNQAQQWLSASHCASLKTLLRENVLVPDVDRRYVYTMEAMQQLREKEERARKKRELKKQIAELQKQLDNM